MLLGGTMTAHIGYQQRRRPEPGFATAASSYQKPPVESRSGMYRPEYRWPALEIGRTINLRHPRCDEWPRFFKELTRRVGQRNGVEMVPLKRFTVPYITGDEMEQILDATYPGQARDPKPKARIDIVRDIKDRLTNLMQGEVGIQLQCEMLGKVSVQALDERDLDFPAATGDFFDGRRWSSALFMVNGEPVTNRLTGSMVKVYDSDEVMATERQTVFDLMASQLGLQSHPLAKLRASDWSPEFTLFTADHPVNSVKIPGYPDQIPFGPPSVHMRMHLAGVPQLSSSVG